MRLPGFSSGLGGALESARIGLGHVDVGAGQMFATITAVVIGGTSLGGGRGGVLQSAVGALTLAVLSDGMVFVGVSPYAQKAVQGALILLAAPHRDMASTRPLEDREVTEPVLRVEGLSKSFAGVRALDDVSIDVRAREVIGLIGENGAGKSTLLKVLAGVLRADRGRIVVRGSPVSPANVAAAAASGIGIVFPGTSASAQCDRRREHPAWS